MAKTKEELVDTINTVVARIKEEFIKYPFFDKYISYYSEYEGVETKFVDYEFENGEKIRFIVMEPNVGKDEYIFEIKLYNQKFGIKSKKKKLYDLIKELLVDITNKSINRPLVNQNVKNRYNRIVRSINIRKTEISNMKGNEPNYNSLIHELNNYKGIADKLKKVLYVNN